MKHFLTSIILFSAFFSGAQTVTDIDGNVYQTVTIGTQVWMKENLKVTHYNNGSSIPLVIPDPQWSSLLTGAYSYYNNDTNNIKIYGLLYNWYTINDPRKIAPIGWHVPTDAEWYTLSNFLSGMSSSGGDLKETGTSHWSPPNSGAVNLVGFTGLPGGYRDVTGFYNHLTNYNDFWSATPDSAMPTHIYHRGMAYNHPQFLRYLREKKYGFSIRCVKDAGPVGMIENSEDQLSIYPNPMQHILNIEIQKQGVALISDLQGQVVRSITLENIKTEIDLSSLSNGLYVLKILSPKTVLTRKLVKQ